MYYHFFLEKSFSPFISAYLIFNILFFIITPLAQLSEMEEISPKYLNTLPHKPFNTIIANIYIIIFNIIFFLSYLIFKNKNTNVKEYIIHKNLPFHILFILFISLLVLLFNFDYIQEKLMTPTWKLKYDKAKSIKIVISKVLFSVPLAGIALVVMYFKKNGKKNLNILIISLSLLLFIFLIFLFKNPFMEKRSGLGPIYFCILFLFFPKIFNTNIKTTLILYFSLIVVMPVMAVFTHVNSSFSEVLQNPKIITNSLSSEILLSNFNTINFDAYINFIATIDYVSNKGFSLGEQLLSAFLFFIPRSIWKTKPNTSGEFIGDYLIDKYDFWFNNISNPFVSEAYLNFGLIGIIIFAILLAYFFSKMLLFLKSDDILKKNLAFFIAIHMIYFLRGDFTNGFSQLILVSFGIYIIPKLSFLFFRK